MQGRGLTSFGPYGASPLENPALDRQELANVPATDRAEQDDRRGIERIGLFQNVVHLNRGTGHAAPLTGCSPLCEEFFFQLARAEEQRAGSAVVSPSKPVPTVGSEFHLSRATRAR